MIIKVTSLHSVEIELWATQLYDLIRKYTIFYIYFIVYICYAKQ
jgi:hypothetical protein